MSGKMLSFISTKTRGRLFFCGLQLIKVFLTLLIAALPKVSVTDGSCRQEDAHSLSFCFNNNKKKIPVCKGN